MIEKSYNVSIRKMFHLPRETHRFFIEPLSDAPHLKFLLMKRFLGFTEQILRSKKKIPRQLFNMIKTNTLSVTGSNLRNIMMLVGKNNINEINVTDLDTVAYFPVKDEDLWKIDLAKELVDIKCGDATVHDFSDDEINDMLVDLCVN